MLSIKTLIKKNNQTIYSSNKNDLRKPKEDDFYVELVDCYWEKQYPTLLYLKEYVVEEYMLR